MKSLTKKILLIINLLVAVGLCFSYLANVVNPAIVWHFAFFGLAYPILILINLAFLILWLWRKKKIALISLIAIIIGFGNMGRYFQVRLNSEPEANSMKVISYNVRVFNHFEWEKEISVRDSILDYLENESAGIICMQEFLTRTDRPIQSEDHVIEKLPSTPYRHINYSSKKHNETTQFGLATFSKYPIVRRGVIMFDNSKNSCIYTDIKKDTDTIRVYNIHLQTTRLKKFDSYLLDSLFNFNQSQIKDLKLVSSRLKESFIKRSDQVNLIVQHMKDSPYPNMVCGDFNDTPVSYTYHQLLGDKKDAFREAGSGVSQTYIGKLPSFRIDYIFYSDIFESVSYKTGNLKLSDHFPIIVSLTEK